MLRVKDRFGFELLFLGGGFSTTFILSSFHSFFIVSIEQQSTNKTAIVEVMIAKVLFAILSVHLVQSSLYYVGVRQSKNYNDAKSACQNFQLSIPFQGQLATWDTAYQYNRIVDAKSKISANEVYVGLDDLNAEGKWRLLDGNTCGGDCDNIAEWNAGEPNDAGNEDCAEIISNGKLNDINCGTGRYFICGVNLNYNPDPSKFVRANSDGFIPDFDVEPNENGNYYAIFEFNSIQNVAFFVSILLNVVLISCICYIFGKNITKQKANYSKVKMYSTEDEHL